MWVSNNCELQGFLNTQLLQSQNALFLYTLYAYAQTLRECNKLNTQCTRKCCSAIILLQMYMYTWHIMYTYHTCMYMKSSIVYARVRVFTQRCQIIMSYFHHITSVVCQTITSSLHHHWVALCRIWGSTCLPTAMAPSGWPCLLVQSDLRLLSHRTETGTPRP